MISINQYAVSDGRYFEEITKRDETLLTQKVERF
jgi:hypothetical protein